MRLGVCSLAFLQTIVLLLGISAAATSASGFADSGWSDYQIGTSLAAADAADIDRQLLVPSIKTSDVRGNGGFDSPPFAPSAGDYYCGPGVGMCSAMMPRQGQTFVGAGQRSLGTSPAQDFSEFLPSPIPPPPRTFA